MTPPRYLCAAERRPSEFDGSCPPSTRDLLERRTRDGAAAAELVYRRKDGSRFVGALTSSFFTDAAGRTRSVAVVRDVTTRREAERRLRENEEALAAERERLAVTLKSIGDAVIATDPDARVTVFNDVAEQLTGWPAAEALGRPLAEVFRIVSEETHEAMETPVQRVLREGTVVGLANHTALVARDGTERPIADSGAPIRDAQGRTLGVVLVFRDQTEERRAEAALRRSEEQARAQTAQLEAILAAVGDGLIVYDREGRTLRSTPAADTLLGIPASERSLPVQDRATLQYEMIAEDGTRPGRDELIAVRAAIHGETVRDSVLSVRAGDHPARWLRMTAVPYFLEGRHAGAVLSLSDITERKLAEESLRRSEVRFRALIEKSTDLILVLDAEGKLQFWSQGAVESLGWTPEEVLGQVLFGLVHPDDRPRMAEERRALLATPGKAAAFSFRLRHRDGSWRSVETTGRNLLDDPAVRGVVVNARDVTSQRALEEQFRQAQKLESVGRLAGGVAHDFNNLLTVILNCSSSLEEALGPQSASLEDVHDIGAAAKRAAELTGQLLAFARKQVVAPVLLDLGEVIRGNEAMLRRLIGEDVDLRVELQPELWSTSADPGQLTQVIVNLAVNARDAMPRGGTLRLCTSNGSTDPGGAAADPERQVGDWVRLEVSDTGTGMSPEVKAHLFEPFFTTKEQGKGTGLGLATVYGIVKQAGGHLHVHSEVGRGTTFELCLPRAPQGAAAALEAPARAEARGGSERILVVEDDPQVRAITTRALRRAGYDVLALAHPQLALDLPPDESGRIQLLLTDVVMPGLDGRTLARALRTRHPALRVLYVSGYTPDVIASRSAAVPDSELLSKPFTGRELLARVRAVLDAG